MSELKINNSKESFTFFLDEENRFCINVKRKNKVIVGSIILDKEDVDDIKKFIDSTYDKLE